MSLCQSEKNSCGACCGIFNLDISRGDINILLRERTENFQNKVNFQNRGSVSEFRQNREIIEEKLPRINPEIYVCPYLGFIKENKIGCMIHPSITGDPNSQNFSFYGASICLGYECKNKTGESVEFIDELLNNLINNSYYEYSNLSGDHLLIEMILELFSIKNRKKSEISIKEFDLINELLLRKFKINKHINITSFEFDFDSIDLFKKITSYLELEEDSILYEKILNIYENPSRGFTF